MTAAYGQRVTELSAHVMRRSAEIAADTKHPMRPYWGWLFHLQDDMPALSTRALVAAAAMARWVDKATLGAHLDIRKNADTWHCSTDYINDGIRELVAAELIVIEGGRGKGWRPYTLLTPWASSPNRSGQQPEQNGPAARTERAVSPTITREELGTDLKTNLPENGLASFGLSEAERGEPPASATAEKDAIEWGGGVHE